MAAKTIATRLETLEAQEAARIEALIYRFALASARVWRALTLEEYVIAAEASSRPGRLAHTDAEDAIVAKIEALENAEGVMDFANPLEHVMSRDELVRRRNALTLVLMDREEAGAVLSADERTIIGEGSAWARLLTRLTNDELDALKGTEGPANRQLVRELAARYSEPPPAGAVPRGTATTTP